MSSSLTAPTESTSRGTAPHFAAVTVRPPVLSPTDSLPSVARDVTLTLYLPHDIATTITGLDADAVTLLVLELVSTATHARPC